MSNTTYKQINLWNQYSETKSSSIRDKLILKYTPLVKYIVGRLSIYFGNNVEYEDMISYGIFGLIDAIDKFDVSKGFKFETYASLRIRGAIIDSIRQLDWVPRTLRQKGKEIEKAYIELENMFGRQPLDSEVAEHLKMNINEFHKIMNDVHISHVLSLEEVLDQNNESYIEAANESHYISPTQNAEFNELKEILAEAINKLPEREKTVITLYYFEELTLKEISAIFKVSESRISQLHSKAVTKLRAKLNRHSSIFYE